MTETRFRFTKASVEAAPLPTKGSKFYWDEKTPGLTVRVTAGGARTFYVYRKVHGKPEQIRIGPFPDLTIEQARNKAAEINGQIALGVDLAARKREERAAKTFGEMFAWYMEHHAKPRKRTWKVDLARHRMHLSHLDRTRVDKVTRTMITDAHAKASERSGIYEANRTLALVRVVFNKAIKAELFAGPNPAQGAEMYREKSRDRRLSAGELPAFLAALEEETNANLRDLVKVLLLTGARKGNALAMRWDEIDWAAKSWRIPETKNGTPHTIPLGAEVLGVLRERRAMVSGQWVFPGESESGHMTSPHKAWTALLARASIQNFRMHDLRRTLGSWMADTGASLNVIGKALNHQHQATTAIYARLAIDPVREAQERAIAAMLDAGTAGENIVPLAPTAKRRTSARR